MNEANSLPEIVERESWDSLAYMAQQFELELDMKNPKTRKVKKELELVRRILHEELRRIGESQEIPSASFFVRMSKTIQRANRGLENNGVRNKAFLLFLKLVLHKLKKLQLVAFKPEHRKEEFEKMKDWIEVHHDII